MRNFDLTALRSFLAVAETGGVTRAAAAVNLTQSAVSMQIRRLETFLDTALLDRAGRGVVLTPAGEQLAAYARRLLALNDEAWGRMTGPDWAGELVIGVPPDLVYQGVPQVMRAFATAYPRVRVRLASTFTLRLKEQFARGEIDILLTTEATAAEGAEALTRLPLIWVGAQGGQAWKRRPLPVAFEDDCIFRRGVLRRLNEAGLPWELAIGGESTRAVEVAVSADMAVYAMIEGAERRAFLEPVPHGGILPALWLVSVNMYVAPRSAGPARDMLADMLRRAYRQLSPEGAALYRDDHLAGGLPAAEQVEP